jgi:hypothetical protein
VTVELVAAHGSTRWHPDTSAHRCRFACACPCVFGLCGCPGSSTSPFLALWCGVSGMESASMLDDWKWGMGREISPHPSSRQRGRGEGGVNLPTALLIAHMPGHQEPAVTLETIPTPPSPSRHGWDLGRGKSTPNSSFFVTFLPLSPLLHWSLFSYYLSSFLSHAFSLTLLIAVLSSFLSISLTSLAI